MEEDTKHQENSNILSAPVPCKIGSEMNLRSLAARTDSVFLQQKDENQDNIGRKNTFVVGWRTF